MNKKFAAFLMATAMAAMPLVSAVAADKSTNAAPELPAAKIAAKPAAKKSRGKPVPVKGKVLAVDPILKTITLEKAGKQTVYQVTAETRFYAGEKPAVMAAVIVGEEVEGRGLALGDAKYDLKALYLKAKSNEAAAAKEVEKKADAKTTTHSKSTNSVPVKP